jgi:hypothetical protein
MTDGEVKYIHNGGSLTASGQFKVDKPGKVLLHVRARGEGVSRKAGQGSKNVYTATPGEWQTFVIVLEQGRGTAQVGQQLDVWLGVESEPFGGMPPTFGPFKLTVQP